MAIITKTIGTATHLAQTGTMDNEVEGTDLLIGLFTAFDTDFTTDDRLVILHPGGLHSYDITAIGSATSITIAGGLIEALSGGETPFKQGTLRNFSTMVGWEAADGDATGSDDAVGECYNDSAFDETVTINSTVPLSWLLSVAAGERHDGTAGTGARIVRTSAGGITLTDSIIDVSLSWLEVDLNDGGTITGVSIPKPNNTTRNISHMIVHNILLSNANSGVFLPDNGVGSTTNLHNLIVYNIERNGTGGTPLRGVYVSGRSGRPINAHNITVYNTLRSSSSGDGYGYLFADTAAHIHQNIISVGTGGGSSGTVQDYSNASPSSGTAHHNMASDTTASGGGSINNAVVADQFISTVGGSEDLHLKVGSDAIDAGVDVGTTPTGVNIDINGRDRDVANDIWDMGAHEFTAPIALPVVLPKARWRI